MGTMRAVMKKDAALGTTIQTVDIPKCGPDDVLLKVKAASICGTDLHIYKWDNWAQGVIKPPLILGHEIAGEVVEVGARVEEGFAKGDLISVESHIPCGKCYQCRHDMRHICDDLKIVGVHRPGGFAEYLSIPAVCAWKNGPGISVEVAALLEPLGYAVYAASEAQVAGQNVAVFGCGPAGLFTIAACKALGAVKVIAVDVNPKHLEMAGPMGADELLDGADPTLMERLESHRGGAGLDISIDMSGNHKAIVTAIRSLRKGGTFVAFGIPPGPIELNLANDVILPGRRILGIVGRHMFRTWELMQRLIESGKLNPAPIITHRYKMADFDEAIRVRASTDAKVGKVILTP
jgi:threonine 3-dehydrogenase